MQGAGIIDAFKNRIYAFHSFRYDFPPKERDLLKLFGNNQITDIEICREPINDALNKVLNVISFGSWDNLKRQYAYDKLYHLFTLIRLDNNRYIKLEKNQVVKISTDFKLGNDVEMFHLPFKQNGLTLNSLIETAINKVGRKQLFYYSPWSTNCQQFLIDLFGSSGLLDDNAVKFIYQDLSELVQKLPAVTKFIGQKTTDLAHSADILIHGKGLKFNKKNLI